tara:strand:- start:41668 stop:42105 length:438 start_codon:yes stop_codon:yes gene_type:complete
MKSNKKVRIWDKVGLFASSLCIVHCLLFPLLMIVFPSITVAMGWDEEFTHELLLAFIVPAVTFAVYSGYRIHKEIKPMKYMVVGFLFVFFGTMHGFGLIDHDLEPIFVLIGSVLMVRGHFLNSHHCKRCEEENHCIWEHEHSHEE